MLGPLEVVGEGGPISLGAPQPRVLLAALIIGRGTLSSVDALIDAVWGESPPPSAPKLLQVYVSQLRKILPASVRIETRPTGYQLELEPLDLDADVFEQLVTDGRTAQRAGNLALAASVLRRALALWRGPAYADVRYKDFALGEIGRLEALRSTALGERIEADLRLGRHADVVGELRGLLTADPTDEHLAALTLVATYRAAGAGEALALFESLRAAIRDELGDEPSPELLRAFVT